MKLEGKTAIVLGGIKGIGRAVGMALARCGVRLGLTYYDWEESLDEMKHVFSEIGTPHHIERVNLLDDADVRTFVGGVVRRFGGIDILINNIERGGWPVVHGSYVRKQWDLELATTLRAKRWVFDAVLPHLKASGDGCVVNLSSIAGIVGRCGPAGYIFNDGYAAANRGVSMLTETWARVGAPEVRVNEIMTGFVETRHGPGTRGWGLLSDDRKKAIIDHTLLGRTGRIEDVVSAVMFVVRDAIFMTGSVMRIDGGYVLGGEPVPPMPDGVL
ncbi:MAG: SDR family oxidoreductase [Deltaproteobacteria bacterium]|nr:SDR family oxidoreductase [Deltaproteobacteria bacterium]